MTTRAFRRNLGRWPGLAFPVALLVAALVGCSGKPVNGPPEHLIGKPWKNVGEVAPARDGDTDAVEGLAAVFAGKPPAQNPGRPLNMLIMSGGGKYGAFTAGAIVGWTAAGDRPVFDVATGISSGAIVATLSFLGPKYDQKLKATFTELTQSNLFKWQIVRGLASGKGILSAEPLERTLERDVNDEFMCDLCAAHREGRRLYVGTGNVLTNRLSVWDLGAIACSGCADSKQLIRKILLASCSPPGVVTPVEIDIEVNGVRYQEHHADAGNLAQAFVRTPAGIPTGSTAWVLSAGKIYRDARTDQPGLVGSMGSAISNSLYALFRSDLIKLYALTAVTKSHYRLLSLPDDFRGEASAFAFDREELNKLYQIGYQLTVNRTEWRPVPPDTLFGEAVLPRTGTRFTYP